MRINEVKVLEMPTPEEGSALFLRSLLSPLRLLSAAMWHLMQQEAVSHYGILEEFVSLVTDSVPELLSYRQKTQLTMGLRARLVLELCGMETLTDPHTVQTHLHRIETLVALHKQLESGDVLVEESGANFVALVQILMKDPAERSTFFRDIYPFHYGVKFSAALQKLMWQFLSKLENALPQPTLHEASLIFSTTPTVLEECLQSLSQPQRISNIFEYQRKSIVERKETLPLWSTAPDECILSCLSSPRLILIGEQTALDIQSESVLDIPSYCQEVQVESGRITQYIESELGTSISDGKDDCMQYDDQETQVFEPVDAKNGPEASYEEINSVDLQTVGTDLNEIPEKQNPFELVMDIEPRDKSIVNSEEKGMAKDGTKLVRPYIIKQPFVKLEKLDLSGRQFSKIFHPGPPEQLWGQPRKNPQNKPCRKKREDKIVTVPSTSVNKPTGQKCISGINPKLKNMYTSAKVESGEYACSLCSFQNGEGIQLHRHLVVHHPEVYKRLCTANKGKELQDIIGALPESENRNSPVSKVRSYRGVPVCKTCPMCGKTFSRSSDMRRHQMSHTIDRPFLCQKCGKAFRYTFDLRRHQQRVCIQNDYVMVYRKKEEMAEEDDGAGIQPVSSVERSVSNVSEPTRGISSPVQGNLHSRRHLRSLSSNHNHKCSQCGEGFKYLYNLKKHEDVCESKRQHTGSAQCLLKESDTGESGTDVTSRPSLLETYGSSEQKQQGNGSQYTNPDSIQQNCDSSERFYRCVKCNALFKSVLDIQKHVKIHWTEDPLQCSHCGKCCLNPSELESHMLVHEQESKLPCTLCSEMLERFDSLREHYLTAHDFKGPYQCSKCDKTHTDLKVIVRHMKSHNEERPYQCSHCSKCFKQRSALNSHAKIHSGVKPFLCEECGKCFISNISLQRHLVSHKTERPYTCPQCKKCFKTHYALQSHLLNHMPRTTIPCEVCGKMFLQASALHRHLRIHTGERPFSCSKCDKKFLTKCEVKKHMRYHTGERPFRCSHCSRTFTQTCYLTVHMRIHTGERPYKCSICKRAFGSTTHLKRHILVHTQERPFKCDCGKSFNQANSLKVHKKSKCVLRKQ